MGFLDNEKIIQEFKENFERTSVNIKDREEIEFSLLEEASEILGLLKKMKFHKHRNLEELETELFLEMGDFLWYYVANLKLNKKYSWEQIIRHITVEYDKYLLCNWNGTNKKVTDFVRIAETCSIGEFFSETMHFLKKETTQAENVEEQAGVQFTNIMRLNIIKLKNRYK